VLVTENVPINTNISLENVRSHYRMRSLEYVLLRASADAYVFLKNVCSRMCPLTIERALLL